MLHRTIRSFKGKQVKRFPRKNITYSHTAYNKNLANRNMPRNKEVENKNSFLQTCCCSVCSKNKKPSISSMKN